LAFTAGLTPASAGTARCDPDYCNPARACRPARDCAPDYCNPDFSCGPNEPSECRPDQ